MAFPAAHPDSLRPGGFRVRGHHDCVAARAQRRPAASPARGPGCHAGWPPGVTVARGTVTWHAGGPQPAARAAALPRRQFGGDDGQRLSRSGPRTLRGTS